MSSPDAVSMVLGHMNPYRRFSTAQVCSLVFAGSARFNLHDMGTAVVAPWFVHLGKFDQDLITTESHR